MMTQKDLQLILFKNHGTLYSHDYLGYGTHDSQCDVVIYNEHEESYIIFIDGFGTSVTNAAEQLVQEVHDKYFNGERIDSLHWYETYDKQEFTEIIPRCNDYRVTSVTWLVVPDEEN